MSISVTCPQCGAINKANDRMAGRRVRCPQCDTAVHVPEQDFDAEPPPLPTDDAPPPSGAERQRAVPPAPLAPAADPLAGDPQNGGSQAGSAAAKSPGLAAGGRPDAADAVAADADDDEDENDQVLKRPKREDEELDMTPMVDVTFLLLIFFMVTAAFSLQKSIEMPRQQTDAPSTTVVEQEEEDLEMVEVQVDEFGSFLVLAADWQEETPGKQNLITALKRANAGGAAARLVIKVHELCKLQYLVDAMDAGTIAGYAETQVTQVEEFE